MYPIIVSSIILKNTIKQSFISTGKTAHEIRTDHSTWNQHPNIMPIYFLAIALSVALHFFFFGINHHLWKNMVKYSEINYRKCLEMDNTNVRLFNQLENSASTLNL